jgi:hypothetical protein
MNVAEQRLLGAQLCNGYGFMDNNRSGLVRDNDGDGIGMQLPLTGGCQCGSVRYQITANPLAVYVCHCTECQRQSGSAFALSLAVAREALVVVEGAPAVWRRELEGGRIIDCLFCGACGVRLFHNPERNPRASIVKPGTLDDTTWLKPVGHIWTRSAQSWVPIPPTTVNYEGQPPDLSRLIEAWKAQEAAE